MQKKHLFGERHSHQLPFCTPSPMSSWYVKHEERKGTPVFGKDQLVIRFSPSSHDEMFPGGGGTSVVPTTVKQLINFQSTYYSEMQKACLPRMRLSYVLV